MKNIFTSSFATKLSVYVLSFTLVVFTCIMALFYTYSRKQITEDAIESTHGLLANIATQISSELRIVETVLNQSVWMVEKNLNRPDSLQNIIAPIVSQNNLIVGSGIAFVPDYYKEKGKYFMPYISSDRQTDALSYHVLGGSDYDYPCMDWYLIPSLLQKSYWSEPYYDTGGGNDIMSTYSLPLRNKQGKVYAIFTANVSLSRFTDTVNKLKPYASSYTFLLSRNGSYLTHPDREKIMNQTIFSDAFSTNNSELENIGYEMQRGKAGTIRFSLNKRDSYTFFTSIPNSGWSVCTVCDSGVILQKLDVASRRILYVFLVGMVVLLLLVHLIIRRLVRPLSLFSKSARSIATGRFDIDLPEIHSQNEMKDLRDSLVYMQHSLSSYVAELRETTATKERIESELCIAHEIQMGMIPKQFPPYPERKDIDLHALLQPAKEVGGDLYDFFIDNERLFFIIGDVSGKGVPASLFMAITRSLFRTLSQKFASPAEIMTQMNRSISENNESNMFVTLFIGVLDLKTGHLNFCNAGHNPPIIISPDGKPTFLNYKIQVFVGVLEDMQYVDGETVLEKGSKLFLYTDGVTEAENATKELYGEQQLQEVLAEVGTSDIRTIVESVAGSVNAHVKEAEASDDLTILLLHYL